MNRRTAPMLTLAALAAVLGAGLDLPPPPRLGRDDDPHPPPPEPPPRGPSVIEGDDDARRVPVTFVSRLPAPIVVVEAGECPVSCACPHHAKQRAKLARRAARARRSS